MDLYKTIGQPALLEQTAEECVELAHACLKYARYLRGDNPTPVTREDCLKAINEEVADVGNAVNGLEALGIIDDNAVLDTMQAKMKRWTERLEGKK